MTSLLWVTDIHLDHIRHPMGAGMWGESLVEDFTFDAVVVTGDIAESYSLAPLLDMFAEAVGKPIYYVLGNHDFFGGSVALTYKVAQTSLEANNLTLLDSADPVYFGNTALVGHTGWYDGVLGNVWSSRFMMTDFKAIADLRAVFSRFGWSYKGREGREALIATVRGLATQAVNTLRPKLQQALEACDQVLVATHYPPFVGAAWHEGALSEPHALPWFTSGLMGNMLAEMAERNPTKQITVLCGHTHSPGVYVHAPNLIVYTGRAVYKFPMAAGMIETSDLTVTMF